MGDKPVYFPKAKQDIQWAHRLARAGYDPDNAYKAMIDGDYLNPPNLDKVSDEVLKSAMRRLT